MVSGRREFPGRADQVGAARRFVAAVVGADDPRCDVARLLVSEAATNAILHSASGRDGGAFTVGYELDGSYLRIEVGDHGGPGVPRRRVHDVESVTGRGLDLFDALCDRWGVEGGPDGRTVWFELDPEAARTSAPAWSARALSRTGG